MLMKIGDITNKFGISRRLLHYWEDAGILTSTRSDNGYRYYDEVNTRRIKQIVLLRRLRLSIPSIHAIFTSEEMSKVIEVFSEHLNETQKEREKLDALSLVLRQMMNMLQDKKDMNSVYSFLDTNHSAETEELKSALKTVFAEDKVVDIKSPPEPVIDMTDIDLTLEPIVKEDLPDIYDVIRRCYSKTDNVDKIIDDFHFDTNLNLKDCAWCYKIVQDGQLIGAVNLIYVGKEAMLIQELAYDEPDNNVYIFERLKECHPEVLCWNILFDTETDSDAPDAKICYIEEDYAGKRRQFVDDNGFTFYTGSRGVHYIKMMKPHAEVDNSSGYRFALLDGSMDKVGFRFFGINGLDFYDGVLTNFRLTDVNFTHSFIFDTWADNARIYDTAFAKSDFRYVHFNDSTFMNTDFTNCVCTGCDFTGMTADGIDVGEAIRFYKEHKENRE